MDKDNSKKIANSPGYLFPVKNKKTAKHPDYKGKFTLNGKEYLLSGWEKEKDGEKFIAISLTDPNDLPQLNSGNNNNNNRNQNNQSNQNNSRDNNQNNRNQNSNQRPQQSNDTHEQEPQPRNHQDDSRGNHEGGDKNIDPDFGDLFQNL